MPMDDTQKILAWSNLVEKGLISKAFFRDEALNVQMPRDEETRIALEQALQSPEMQLKAQLRALQKSYDQADWELMIQGTPLQQVHEQEQQWEQQKEAQAEAAREARRQEKMQKEMQERMMEQMANMPPPPMGPEMMPPGGMPPGGIPLGGPPMPPGIPPGPPATGVSGPIGLGGLPIPP